MTDYIVLLLGDTEAWWDTPDEEKRATYDVHGRFTEELERRGHTIIGDGSKKLWPEQTEDEQQATIAKFAGSTCSRRPTSTSSWTCCACCRTTTSRSTRPWT